MKQNTSNMPKVVEDCHELLAWIIPKIDQFPLNRRFTYLSFNTMIYNIGAALIQANVGYASRTFNVHNICNA